jgi:uncharacterized membrane protein YeaQ/YmgE (transglycosylase-associated protein family)
MSFGTWIIAGLVAAFLTSKLVIRSGEGLLRDLILGVLGAIVAGWLFSALTAVEGAGLDPFGLIVTLAGASALLIVYHTLFPRVRQR